MVLLKLAGVGLLVSMIYLKDAVVGPRLGLALGLGLVRVRTP